MQAGKHEICVAVLSNHASLALSAGCFLDLWRHREMTTSAGNPNDGNIGGIQTFWAANVQSHSRRAATIKLGQHGSRNL